MEIVKQIIEYDKISGVFMGPYDLSMSMGIPGEFKSEKFIKAYNSVREICSKQDKLFCTFTSDNKTIEEEINKGTDMIAVGVDANLILNAYSELIKPFK